MAIAQKLYARFGLSSHFIDNMAILQVAAVAHPNNVDLQAVVGNLIQELLTAKHLPMPDTSFLAGKIRQAVPAEFDKCVNGVLRGSVLLALMTTQRTINRLDLRVEKSVDDGRMVGSLFLGQPDLVLCQPSIDG